MTKRELIFWFSGFCVGFGFAGAFILSYVRGWLL